MRRAEAMNAQDSLFVPSSPFRTILGEAPLFPGVSATDGLEQALRR